MFLLVVAFFIYVFIYGVVRLHGYGLRNLSFFFLSFGKGGGNWRTWFAREWPGGGGGTVYVNVNIGFFFAGKERK